MMFVLVFVFWLITSIDKLHNCDVMIREDVCLLLHESLAYLIVFKITTDEFIDVLIG